MVVCFHKEYGEFIAESSLLPLVVIGVGKTKEEALECYKSHLESAYEELVKDNVAGYSDGVRLRNQPMYQQFAFTPTTKEALRKMAEELGLSECQVVDYLLFFKNCYENQ